MSTGKKKGLGRGLSALFGDEISKSSVPNKKELFEVSISDLNRNPYQPREAFNEEKLQELANSIKKNGIIQPIAVRPKKIIRENMKLSLGKEDGLQLKKQDYMKYL